jgi:hypothetical protein
MTMPQKGIPSGGRKAPEMPSISRMEILHKKTDDTKNAADYSEIPFRTNRGIEWTSMASATDTRITNPVKSNQRARVRNACPRAI